MRKSNRKAEKIRKKASKTEDFERSSFTTVSQKDSTARDPFTALPPKDSAGQRGCPKESAVKGLKPALSSGALNRLNTAFFPLICEFTSISCRFLLNFRKIFQFSHFPILNPNRTFFCQPRYPAKRGRGGGGWSCMNRTDLP